MKSANNKVVNLLIKEYAYEIEKHIEKGKWNLENGTQ
jgi:hypothetical protein